MDQLLGLIRPILWNYDATLLYIIHIYTKHLIYYTELENKSAFHFYLPCISFILPLHFEVSHSFVPLKPEHSKWYIKVKLRMKSLGTAVGLFSSKTHEQKVLCRNLHFHNPILSILHNLQWWVIAESCRIIYYIKKYFCCYLFTCTFILNQRMLGQSYFQFCIWREALLVQSHLLVVVFFNKKKKGYLIIYNQSSWFSIAIQCHS